MRIAILTQPLRYNYGGILQNFALQTVLKRMGHDVVTLDPYRYQYTKWQYVILILRHCVARYIKGYKHVPILGEWMADKPTRLLGTNTFKFIDKYIKRREYKDLYKDIKEGEYDAFIVGSDQVWRPEYNTNIRNMFLDFTKGWNVKRIAYAASFGIDTWKESEEITRCCREYLKQFDFVSVREDSGATLCKEVFNVEATHVLDPTMLLSKEDYISLLKLDKVPKSEGNLLIYILDYTDEKRVFVKTVANKYRLTPFRVNSDVEDYALKDIERRIQPPVESWIRGFCDAEYVITDSFHACVFAILFRKPFVALVNDKRGTARFRSLLEQLDLFDCAMSNIEGFTGFHSIPDDTISKLASIRKSSKRLLELALN